MNPHTRTLPSLFSLLSHPSPLQRCRGCYYSTSTINSKARNTSTLPPTTPPHSTPTPHITPPRNSHLSSYLHEREEDAERTREPLTQRSALRETHAMVEGYLANLEAGELIDGNRWEELFTRGSHIGVHHASRLLKFAREAKMLTPHRYFIFLLHLLDINEIVATQLALNTMIEDGVRLTNWQLEQLLVGSITEYTLFFRLLALMDLDAWDYAVAIPRIAAQTQRMLDSFYFTGRGVRTKTNLGHLMHMVPHLSPRLLEAMATCTEQLNELAHAHAYITRTGLLPTMKIYQHFGKFLPLPLLPQMYQQMKQRGLIPTPKMYNEMLARFKQSGGQPPAFAFQLINDMKLLQVKYTQEVGLIAIELCLQANNQERAFEISQEILAGPFTQEEHHFVTQAIRKFVEGFRGGVWENAFNSLLLDTLNIPPAKFIPPNANKVLLAIDDEW